MRSLSQRDSLSACLWSSPEDPDSEDPFSKHLYLELLSFYLIDLAFSECQVITVHVLLRVV